LTKFSMNSCAADHRGRPLPRHYFRLDPEIYSIVKDRRRETCIEPSSLTGANQHLSRGNKWWS